MNIERDLAANLWPQIADLKTRRLELMAECRELQIKETRYRALASVLKLADPEIGESHDEPREDVFAEELHVYPDK